MCAMSALHTGTWDGLSAQTAGGSFKNQGDKTPAIMFLIRVKLTIQFHPNLIHLLGKPNV